MAELKTKPSQQRVKQFLQGVLEERKRVDSFTILELMKGVTAGDGQDRSIEGQTAYNGTESPTGSSNG